ncbi:MAG TPA: protein kinase [Pseudonocardiaceae bacterium]|nr:protein kinase [Pseudonocardiaceae bacterium]
MERALGSRYRLGDPLGSGAMGQVFAGVDTAGGQFAFKVLRSDLVRDPGLVARFLQERSILTSLRHPNLVGVHDLVVEGDTVAIVMDLVRGGDLRAWLSSSGTLLPAEVARIGAGIAAALAQVHAAGVVHGDVKPENILMDDSGAQRTPKLTDFGMSTFVNKSDTGRSSVLVGTPRYLAPELAAGKPASPAADLYSLGIVLYELCCGVPPFIGPSMVAVIKQHAELEPGRPDGIPDMLWDAIRWLLAKGPQARPQSAARVATVLAAMVDQLANAPVGLRLDNPPTPTPIAHSEPTQQVAGWQGANRANGATPGGTVPKRKRGRRLAVLVLAIVLIGGGWLAIRLVSGSPSNAAASTPTKTADPGTGAPLTLSTTTEEAPSSVAPPLTTMPNLVGKSLSQAETIIPGSVHIDTVDSLAENAQDGTITAQQPAAGQPLNGTIQLTVARQAVVVYLDTLPTADGGWASNEPQTTSLGGKSYLDSVQAPVGVCQDPYFVEYNVSKGFRRLSATAGIDDNSADSGLVMDLEIFADGRRVFNQQLKLGAPVPVNVDLTGVLRLRFQWQMVSGGDNCDGDNYLDLGEAELLGVPGEVPTTSVSPTD